MAYETRKPAHATGVLRRVVPDASVSTQDGTHLVKVLGLSAGLRVQGKRDQKIAQIAAAQRGRVSRSQLLAAGISCDVMRRLVRQSMLFPLLPGVFAVGHLAPIELGDETSALLAVHEGAALSDQTAGLLWGITRRHSDDDEVIHVLLPRGSGRGPAGVEVHRSRLFTPRDVRVRDGLPVTSPAWTLLDLAQYSDERRPELAFDQAMVSGIVRVSEIRELLARVRGHRGRANLLALLDDDRAPLFTRSEAEERMLHLIRAGHLPEPAVNARVCGYELVHEPLAVVARLARRLALSAAA